MNYDMTKILNSKLTVVSGWGSGLGVLFSFFHKKLNLSLGLIQILDNIFSVLVLVFLVALTRAITTGLVYSKDGIFSEDNENSFKILIVTITCSLICFWGIFFIDSTEEFFGKTKTAVVIGAVLTAVSTYIVYAGVIQLIKGVKHESS